MKQPTLFFDIVFLVLGGQMFFRSDTFAQQVIRQQKFITGADYSDRAKSFEVFGMVIGGMFLVAGTVKLIVDLYWLVR